MSAFAPVTINADFGGTAPVPAATVTYVPSSIDANGVAHWYKDESVFDSRPHLSMSVRLPTKGSQVSRVQVKLVHPLMDAVDTTLKVGECILNLECVYPKRSTQAQRLAIAGQLADYFWSDEFAAAISELESIY